MGCYSGHLSTVRKVDDEEFTGKALLLRLSAFPIVFLKINSMFLVLSEMPISLSSSEISLGDLPV